MSKEKIFHFQFQANELNFSPNLHKKPLQKYVVISVKMLPDHILTGMWKIPQKRKILPFDIEKEEFCRFWGLGALFKRQLGKLRSQRKSAILIITVLMSIMLEKKMFPCPCASVCPSLPHRLSRSYQSDVRGLLGVSHWGGKITWLGWGEFWSPRTSKDTLLLICCHAKCPPRPLIIPPYQILMTKQAREFFPWECILGSTVVNK